MKLYNSLTRKIEDFKPIDPPRVGVYTCGPTVYNYATIGNWRTYILSDLLIRALKYLDFKPRHVMNITDVGHLTGDSSTGEDKVEKAAKAKGQTAEEVAAFYTKEFMGAFGKLNLLKADVFPRATQHIQEQIELIKKIDKKGLAYRTSDGVYFDVKAYEAGGAEYGVLSPLDEIMAGARVEINPEKKDPRDFALWKFSPQNSKRHMEWDSPWGRGFPGWHIECSAMSIKYLGEQFDVHLGGEDLKSTHHPNEIAQSESATGKRPFVKYWMHGAFLKVNKRKMSKSLGNLYTLDDLSERGFNPLDFRYLCLQTHYRKSLNFTWEGLKASQKSLARLRSFVSSPLESAPSEGLSEYRQKFVEAISDDLNLPKAMAVVWDLVGAARKGEVKRSEAVARLLNFDRVLGLGLKVGGLPEVEVLPEVKRLLEKRRQARKNKDYRLADEIRREIESRGYHVIDTGGGVKVVLAGKQLDYN